MIERALIIAEPWIGKILRGEKNWEMRSRATGVRGTIGLVRKGSKAIVGVADLAGTGTHLDEQELAAAFKNHRIPPEAYADPAVRKWNIPWFLENVRPLVRDVPYRHVNGQVTWVTVPPEIAAEVRSALRAA